MSVQDLKTSQAKKRVAMALEARRAAAANVASSSASYNRPVQKQEPQQEQHNETKEESDPFDPCFTPKEYTQKFLDFMNTSPTVFHAVRYLADELENEGFKYISERDSWDSLFSKSLEGRYYTIRNGSSLCAFAIGKNWKPSQGAGIIGAHIDALCTKLKPISKKAPVEGYEQLGVAPYASSFSGPTWWDRDLGLGGKVIVKQTSKDGKTEITSKLVNLGYPVARVPTLAPHFGAPAVGPFNPETQMTPIIGLTGEGEKEEEPTEEEKKSPLVGKHSLKLIRAVAKQLGVEVKDMIQWELELFDTQPGTVGGLEGDFLFCPRIDDKICSYCGVHGFIDSLNSKDRSHDDIFHIVTLFDNEEIGSLTRQGARGGLLESTIDRVLEHTLKAQESGTDDRDEIKRRFYANSFLVSADVIHAINPNFANVYLEHHKPKLNVGISLTCDPNGHMATDGVSTAFIEEVARRTGNTLQYFQIRNDSRSGGTIGPAISSHTGIRAVDCGVPQLAMHSIRATTGSKDVWLGVRMFKAFYDTWKEVDNEFKLGDL